MKEVISTYQEKLDKIFDIKEIIDYRPLNRVTFYATGSRYISLLEHSQPRLTEHIEQLFYEMNKETF